MSLFKLFWREILIGLIILICASTVGILKYQLNSCKGKLAESKAQVIVLSSAIELQNKNIESLGKETEAAKKSGLEAQKKAEVIVRASEKKIEALRRVPVTNSHVCEVSMGEIKQLLDKAHE
jgi:peroxiredoxin